MSNKSYVQFGEYFRQFRTRAVFKTLSEFGQALAEEGFVFEDNAFSRWQSGKRIPSDRKVLLSIIKILAENNGIKTLVEANRLLEAAGQGYLTDTEIEENISSKLLKTPPFQAPPDIHPFIGRSYEIEIITNKLLQGKTVIVTGPAGMGKTALALRLAHKLKSRFPDGILWSRLDTSDPMSVLEKIAYTYGENISSIKDLESRAEVVRSLLSEKTALLVFDNARSTKDLEPLLPNGSLSSVLVTSRKKNLAIASKKEEISLSPFSEKEARDLFKTMCKKEWIDKNENTITELSRLLGYLPLGLNIASCRLCKSPNERTADIVKKLKHEKTRLNTLKYGDLSLRTSFNLSFQDLNAKQQKFFAALGVFAGMDFSIEAAAAAGEVNKERALDALEDLYDLSLVERSSNNRYRLHPLIKDIAEEKIRGNKPYVNALNYYINFLKRKSIKNSMDNFPSVEDEYDNIMDLIDKCLKLNENKPVVNIWDDLATFMFYSGNRFYAKSTGEKIFKAAKKLKDLEGLSLCCYHLCLITYWGGDKNSARDYAEKGLKFAKKSKNKKLIMLLKFRLGMARHGLNKFKESKILLDEALKYFKNENSINNLVNIYLHLGLLFRKQSKTDKSTKHFELALSCAEQINDNQNMPILLSYLGENNLILGNFSRAEKFFLEALQKAKRNKYLTGEASYTWNLAYTDLALGRFDIAIRRFKKAKKLFKLVGLNALAKQAEKDIKQAEAKDPTIDPEVFFRLS